MTDDPGPIVRAAHLETDPSYWPRQIVKAGDYWALMREQYTIAKKLERPTLIRNAQNIRAKNPSMTLAESERMALISEDYRNYVQELAYLARAVTQAEARFRASQAEHEAARTYEVSRREASRSR